MNLRTLVVLTVFALPLFAASKTAEIVIFTLDVKTEIPPQDRDRTDSRFFHGMAILSSEHASDRQLQHMLCELAEDAKRSGHKPAVRDGEFGVRLHKNGEATQDLLVCFRQCRSPLFIVIGKSDREVGLAPDQVRVLREAIDRLVKQRSRARS